MPRIATLSVFLLVLKRVRRDIRDSRNGGHYQVVFVDSQRLIARSQNWTKCVKYVWLSYPTWPSRWVLCISMQWLRLKGCHVTCDEWTSGEICSLQHMWVTGTVMWAAASDESLKFGVQGATATNWFPRVNGARDNGIWLYLLSSHNQAIQMAHSKCTSNSKDTGSLNCAHRSPMVSTPWINWKCLLFRLLPSITPLGRHFSVYPMPLQPPWDSSPNLFNSLSPQPITQLLLLHPDYNTFYSNHCHNGQGQPPMGHRAECLMSGGRGLPKPRHTHATTPVSRKHQFSSAKLHVSMFLNDIASCHDVPMMLTVVFTMLLDIPVATPADQIQCCVGVPQELHAVARPPVWDRFVPVFGRLLFTIR